MKKIILIMLFSLLFSCNKTSNKKTTNTPDLSVDKIEILDFYGKHRCTSCIQIEKNTKATLNSFFKEELKSKKIIFKMIQWDDPENDALVDKYQAAGTSLILHQIKGGKEYIDDLSDLAFKKCEHPEAFSSMLKSKIEEALKKQ